MDHLAILSKKKKVLKKIISLEKTIESRWYKFPISPYKLIHPGEYIYFKESGDVVKVRGLVTRVKFFEKLTKKKIKQILVHYGKKICIDDSAIHQLQEKKYCTLIWLGDIQLIMPFSINKKGYGIGVAWITIKDINSLKK